MLSVIKIQFMRFFYLLLINYFFIVKLLGVGFIKVSLKRSVYDNQVDALHCVGVTTEEKTGLKYT